MLVEDLDRAPARYPPAERDATASAASRWRAPPTGRDPDGHQPAGHQRHQGAGILAEDPATAHIPVIALSANAMPRDIEKGLEAGFFRYLTKPIKVNEFMDTLDVALKFARQRTPHARREERA